MCLCWLAEISGVTYVAGPYDKANDLECGFMKVEAAKQGLFLKFDRP